jgi:hypothetical protein
MNPGTHHLALRDDLDAAGFTGTERTALWAALDKPGTELTEGERALLARYEIARDEGVAA